MNEEEAKKYWTKSNWKKGDLEGKSVEFKWPSGNGFLQGLGTFLVSGPNPEEMLFIQIVVTRQTTSWAEFVSIHNQLPQAAVDRIRPHPDRNVADFLLA